MGVVLVKNKYTCTSTSFTSSYLVSVNTPISSGQLVVFKRHLPDLAAMCWCLQHSCHSSGTPHLDHTSACPYPFPPKKTMQLIPVPSQVNVIRLIASLLFWQLEPLMPSLYTFNAAGKSLQVWWAFYKWLSDKSFSMLMISLQNHIHPQTNISICVFRTLVSNNLKITDIL